MDKLAALRTLMKERNLDAYIISGGDVREWISGFSGSAGTVVVTPTEAVLWTDGRYFIQAEQELAGAAIDLYKMGEPGVPAYEAFLLEKLPEGGNLGFDGKIMSAAAFDRLKKQLEPKNLTYAYQEDLVDALWADRPASPCHPVFEHPPKFAGLSAVEKLRIVRDRMKEHGVTAYLVSALDDIAWLLNIRGQDVPNTPVANAYVLLTEKDAHVFIDPAKVADIAGKLSAQGFMLHGYEAIADKLKALKDESIYYNRNITNVLLSEGAISDALKYVDTRDIIAFLKGAKSEAELANIRNAYIKEGVAMTKLLKWLDDSISAGDVLTEDDVVEKLKGFRKQQADYLYESLVRFLPMAQMRRKRTISTKVRVQRWSPKAFSYWTQAASTWTAQPTPPAQSYWAS